MSQLSQLVHAVLTDVFLFRLVVSYQWGLPVDLGRLARHPKMPLYKTLPRIVVRLSDPVRHLERIYRLKQEQPEYARQQPKLSFEGLWLEAIKEERVVVARWVDDHPDLRKPVKIDTMVWDCILSAKELREVMAYVVEMQRPRPLPPLQLYQIIKVVRYGQTETLRALNSHQVLAGQEGARLLVDFAMERPSEQLEMVQLLHESGCAGWSHICMDEAASKGFLEIVRFLRENRSEGCTTRTMNQAAANGHFEVVRFLHQNRSERCTTRAMDLAAANGHLAVVRFLHENRFEGCTTHAMDQAAADGHLDVVCFLHKHRSEGCTTEAMDQAAARGRLDVVRFLHEHRSEGCTTRAMDQAAARGRLDVVRFLHENRSEGCTPEAIKQAVARDETRFIERIATRGITKAAK